MEESDKRLEVQFHLTPRPGHEGPHVDLTAPVLHERDPATGGHLVRGDPWPGRSPGEISAVGATLWDAVLNWVGASLDARQESVEAAVRTERAERGAARRAVRRTRRER